MASKRSFPYWSEVKSFDLDRGTLPSGVHPGLESEEAPKTFEDRSGHLPNPDQQKSVTDFSTWSEQNIKDFLELRGEDYDDCTTFSKLVVRAQECEVSTGPAPDPSAASAAVGGEAEEEEYDPLDAFMTGIENEIKAAKAQAPKPKPKPEQAEEEDNVADYMEARKAAGAAVGAVASAYHGYNSDEEVYATAKALDKGVDVEYDSDDNPVVGDKRNIEPLPPVDHSAVDYDDFNKDFYVEAQEIASLEEHKVNEMRRTMDIHVSGYGCPRPVNSFKQCGFDARLMGAINKQGYTSPTPIQAQAIPAVLSGRDVLGIAKTGSGKTAAFVLPMLVHIMDQPELEKGEGPIGIVVAPTRELSEQIHKETRKFSKPYGLRCVAAFGGLSKHEQFKHLKAGSDVAVCTPGRLIDLIKMKACTCKRATYLVFDEADRMFDMGFEPQVRSIVGQVRPDRQTLLFSATMPKRVERLARDTLTDPVRITIGRAGGANEDINQAVEVMEDDAAKFGWLLAKMPGFVDQGDVMVFVNQKARVDELVERLKGCSFRAEGVHGDHDQHTRMDVLRRFRSGEIHVLVATDVAARGLDIKSIKTVVNMDAPKDIDTYVHRIGRTGRAGDKEGVAYTFVTKNQANFAGELVHTLVASNQNVPRSLHELALKSPKFRHGGRGGKGGGRGRGRGRSRQVGGAGIGFSQDPDSKPPQSSADAAARTAAPSSQSFPSAVANPTDSFTSDATDQNVGKASTPLPRFSSTKPGNGSSLPGFASGGSNPRMPGFVSATSAPAAGTTTQQSREELMGQLRQTGTAQLKEMYANRFKTSFVASSTGTVKPDAPVATVVAPRRQPTQPAPPPPVPANVAAAPAMAAQQIASRYGTATQSVGPAPSSSDPAFGAALAAAKAVAARLGAPPSDDQQPRKRKWDA